MKRKIIFPIIIVVIAAMGNNSCYKDEGNYDYKELPLFYVDTTGIYNQSSITMRQFEQVNITPNLVFEGDKTKIQHHWFIYSSSGNNIAQPIPGHENAPTLSMTMMNPPGSYRIEYNAFDPVSGRQAMMRWSVAVEGALGNGWLVYYSKNGLVDCDLIKTNLIVADQNEEIILRGIYSQANPNSPITKEPRFIGHLSSSATRSWINLMYEGGGVRVSSDDMAITKEFDQLTYEPFGTPNPEGYRVRHGQNSDNTSGTELFVNNGGLYHNNTGNGGSDPIFSFATMWDGSPTYIAPHAFEVWGSNVLAYDQLNMCFVWKTLWSGMMRVVSSSAPNPVFDFSNVGKKMIYADWGYNPTALGGTTPIVIYSIFKNPVDNGERYIYSMCMYGQVATAVDNTTLAVMDLTGAPEVADAELFAFALRGPVAYYAGTSTVYRILFNPEGVSTPTVQSGWTAPNGETITSMKFIVHPGVGLSERADYKYLFVSTWNGTEGKVYMLESNVSNGVLAAEPVAVFTGFGRIKDMCYKIR